MCVDPVFYCRHFPNVTAVFYLRKGTICFNLGVNFVHLVDFSKVTAVFCLRKGKSMDVSVSFVVFQVPNVWITSIYEWISYGFWVFLVKQRRKMGSKLLWNLFASIWESNKNHLTSFGSKICTFSLNYEWNFICLWTFCFIWSKISMLYGSMFGLCLKLLHLGENFIHFLDFPRFFSVREENWWGNQAWTKDPSQAKPVSQS